MSVSESPRHSLTKRKTITQEKKIAEDEFMAAAIGDVEWLRQSLRGQKGAINYDRNGLAPIHLAAIHGRVECLKLLIEKFKVDVNSPSSTGWRPVHLCISNQTGKRAYQSLHYLLDKNADPSVPNCDGITPMHQAASEGHVQCLKALIEAGGKVWEKDDRGHTPIDLAKLWGHRKCARILATENWHQSKQFMAQEMQQLKKIKMQQVLEDIGREDQMKQDQAFYGDMAFNEWLTSRGLVNPEPKKPEPSKTKLKPKPKVASADDGREDRKDTLQKANSRARRQPIPSPIQEEPSRRALAPDFQRNNTFYSDDGGFGSARSRQQDEKSMKATSEATKQPSTKAPESEPLWYNPNSWEYSKKVPVKPYEPNLPDHYPHDVFTMQPKFAPKRKDFKNAPYAKAKATVDQEEMPNLPADVIDRTLHPEKYERPVVYKCKHIDDIHKKEHYPMERLPKQEIGIHMADNMDSFLFKRGLQQPPRLRSMTSSQSSTGSTPKTSDVSLMTLLDRSGLKRQVQ